MHRRYGNGWYRITVNITKQGWSDPNPTRHPSLPIVLPVNEMIGQSPLHTARENAATFDIPRAFLGRSVSNEQRTGWSVHCGEAGWSVVLPINKMYSRSEPSAAAKLRRCSEDYKYDVYGGEGA